MAALPAQLPDVALSRYVTAEGVALRHWDGETTAMVRLDGAGSTHLIGGEALAVLQVASLPAQGLRLREIGHALGLDGEPDLEAEAGLRRIIDGLIQAGLLRRVDDDANPGSDLPR